MSSIQQLLNTEKKLERMPVSYDDINQPLEKSDLKSETKPEHRYRLPSFVKQTSTEDELRTLKRKLSELIQTHGSEEDKQWLKKKQDHIIYSYSQPLGPNQWTPTITLPKEYQGTIKLITLEALPLKPQLGFKLGHSYVIEKVLPRSYFSILQQYNIGHTFVFAWPDHLFFTDLSGLRKSAYFVIYDTNDQPWHLHLKPSRERKSVFGYLCRGNEINKIIQERADSLLKSRKIPLVLDLDDTLVRMIGDQPNYIPETKASLVSDRVKELKDGRRVVLTEKVHEFLEWASKYFEIFVCSLGDQAYVDMVVAILDPSRSLIRYAYSARGEYLYLNQYNQKKPPKDLAALFPFQAIDLTSQAVEPLILDDNVLMWEPSQQDNIIIVRESSSSPVWNVALFPIVQQVLSYVHESFFRQIDAGVSTSTIACYKEYLRKELATKIANH